MIYMRYEEVNDELEEDYIVDFYGKLEEILWSTSGMNLDFSWSEDSDEEPETAPEIIEISESDEEQESEEEPEPATRRSEERVCILLMNYGSNIVFYRIMKSALLNVLELIKNKFVFLRVKRSALIDKALFASSHNYQ